MGKRLIGRLERSFSKRHWAHPAELSVVGYEDSPLASKLWPALSTIRLSVRDIGRQAAALLLA